MPLKLSKIDLEDLRRRGLTRGDVQRQMSLIRKPSRHGKLLRPCTAGDGVQRLTAAAREQALRRYRQAAEKGRLMGFVPASGAATRMFNSFAGLSAGPWAWSSRMLKQLSETAVGVELAKFLRWRGLDLQKLIHQHRTSEIVETLLSKDGLNLSSSPKALLPFHAYPGRTRTAIEEHIVEAASFLKDGRGECRLHFTLLPEHRLPVQKAVKRVLPHWERSLRCRFQLRYSVQDPATETIAVDQGGNLCRRSDGRLLFRPGGHGALLLNLSRSGGDIVHVKNIDNIVPDRSKKEVCYWQKILLGHLALLQDGIFDHVSELGRPPREETVEAAETFARRSLSFRPAAGWKAMPLSRRREYLLDMLYRPLRVCGVVKNLGEPGGGPFWFQDEDGRISMQILEAAEISMRSPAEKRAFQKARYFNPVNLACGLRDWRGRAFDLRRFVDSRSVIVTRKIEGGKQLNALEWPGLWNGGMAGWNTVFVECPEETFAPVKSFEDLSRPEHRA